LLLSAFTPVVSIKSSCSSQAGDFKMNNLMKS
jgi:hypothetical protein